MASNFRKKGVEGSQRKNESKTCVYVSSALKFIQEMAQIL
jgi:hypothetical protein